MRLTKANDVNVPKGVVTAAAAKASTNDMRSEKPLRSKRAYVTTPSGNSWSIIPSATRAPVNVPTLKLIA